MKSAVIAVQSNDQPADSQHPTQSAVFEAAPVRFTYPSGSRPLEGYTIKRGVGHGGFGEVYYAVSDAGKEVALKLIRRNLDVELRGIRHCLNLKHPDLLSVFDIRQDKNGDNWVVMEYVTGACLEDLIAAHPNGVPLDEALAWMHGIGAGVAYLHDHGIVHRDLKPGNIFSDEGIVKIGDYGLSKFISCSRRSGQTESIGTVHYMAPEVANGRYGKEIDVYALGIIFYEMLTGRLPFEGESVGEVLMKHLTAEPDLSPLTEPYRSVIGRALQKDPEKRFSSVDEMLRLLPKPVQPRVGSGPLPSGSAPRPRRRVPLGAADAAAAPIAAEAVDEEEPIWRFVRQQWQRGIGAFHQLNTSAKIAVVAIGIFLLLTASGPLVAALMLLGLAYGCYWVARAIVLSVKTPAAPTTPPPVAPATAAAPPAATPDPPKPPPVRAVRAEVGRWKRRHEQPVEALVMRSRRQRIAELLGSMVGGALVAITMCLVMVTVTSFDSTVPKPEVFAWLALMSIAGIWTLMIPAKLWEGTEGDSLTRRFVLMVLGLAVGLVAFASASYLGVTLPYDRRFAELLDLRPPSDFYLDGQPQLMAYLACFATLFAAVRWWRQADPLRRARMSVAALIISVFAGGLVAAIWHFPQPWLIILAATMSVSLQVACPWLHPKRRRHETRHH